MYVCVYCVAKEYNLYIYKAHYILYIHIHINILIYTYISVFVEKTSCLTPEQLRSGSALTSWATQQLRLSHSDCSQQRGRDSSSCSAQQAECLNYGSQEWSIPGETLALSACREPGSSGSNVRQGINCRSNNRIIWLSGEGETCPRALIGLLLAGAANIGGRPPPPHIN